MTVQNGIPWWYFHEHGGPYEGRTIAAVDPDGVDRPAHRARAHDRLRRLSRAASWSRRASCAPSKATASPLGELDGSRTERVEALAASFVARRLQVARARRHPRRDLAQAVGQPVVQPDQRADARHAGRHLPLSADARAGRGDDGRSAADRREARHHVPRHDREAHRRRRGGRRAQDVDAAGRRGGPRRSRSTRSSARSSSSAGSPARRRRTSTSVYACVSLLDESLASPQAARRTGGGGSRFAHEVVDDPRGGPRLREPRRLTRPEREKFRRVPARAAAVRMSRVIAFWNGYGAMSPGSAISSMTRFGMPRAVRPENARVSTVFGCRAGAQRLAIGRRRRRTRRRARTSCRSSPPVRRARAPPRRRARRRCRRRRTPAGATASTTCGTSASVPTSDSSTGARNVPRCAPAS